jgi:hypothetical protein
LDMSVVPPPSRPNPTSTYSESKAADNQRAMRANMRASSGGSGFSSPPPPPAQAATPKSTPTPSLTPTSMQGIMIHMWVLVRILRFAFRFSVLFCFALNDSIYALFSLRRLCICIRASFAWISIDSRSESAWFLLGFGLRSLCVRFVLFCAHSVSYFLPIFCFVSTLMLHCSCFVCDLRLLCVFVYVTYALHRPCIPLCARSIPLSFAFASHSLCIHFAC